MKRGAKNTKTIATIAAVERHARKTRKRIWKDIAQRLRKSTRSRIRVNVWKINCIAKKLKGKTMIVPGKVLGNGELTQKVSVIALEFSESALRKIGKNGRAQTISEAVEKNAKECDLVIVA